MKTLLAEVAMELASWRKDERRRIELFSGVGDTHRVRVAEVRSRRYGELLNKILTGMREAQT